MRLTFHLLGVEVFDLAFGDDEPTEPEAVGCRGDVTSYPVGFTRAEVPWEDGGSAHQFEPDEDA